MSRSYKKNPVAKDASDRAMKRIANRTARRRVKDDEDMPAPSAQEDDGKLDDK
jgi:hypothetical protein